MFLPLKGFIFITIKWHKNKVSSIQVTNETLSDHTITNDLVNIITTYAKAHLGSLFSKHNEERRSRPTHNWWTLILVSWSLQITISHGFKTILVDENHTSMSKFYKPPLQVIPNIQSSTFQLISFYWPKSFQSAVTFCRNVKFIWGNQETQSDWVWNDNFVWDLKTKLIFRFLLN